MILQYEINVRLKRMKVFYDKIKAKISVCCRKFDDEKNDADLFAEAVASIRPVIVERDTMEGKLKSIERWVRKIIREENLKVDYMKGERALYIMTDIGCWKIKYNRKSDKFLRYHKNFYDSGMDISRIVSEEYHIQKDMARNKSIMKLIKYLADHDKAKKIVEVDYKKLPRATAKQQKYYNSYKNKEKRAATQRVWDLFEQIEKENPELKSASIY